MSVKAWSTPHTHVEKKKNKTKQLIQRGLGVAVLACSSQLLCLFQEGHTMKNKVKRALKCVQQLLHLLQVDIFNPLRSWKQ